MSDFLLLLNTHVMRALNELNLHGSLPGQAGVYNKMSVFKLMRRDQPQSHIVYHVFVNNPTGVNHSGYYPMGLRFAAPVRGYEDPVPDLSANLPLLIHRQLRGQPRFMDIQKPYSWYFLSFLS